MQMQWKYEISIFYFRVLICIKLVMRLTRELWVNINNRLMLLRCKIWAYGTVNKP